MVAPGPKPKRKQRSDAVKVVTRRNGNTKHPWDQVRDHYMTAETHISMKDLAEVYGIRYEIVRNKASQERWTYLRAEYQASTAVARREARTQQLVKESLGFDDMSLKAAKLGQTLIVGRLGQIAALFQAQGVNFDRVLEKVRNGVPLEPYEMRSSINYKELVELANALDRFQNVGRKALGTDVENVNVRAILDGNVTSPLEASIREELVKPDIDRTMGVIEAMRRAGLHTLLEEQLALTAGAHEDDDEELDGIAEVGDDENSPGGNQAAQGGSGSTVLVGEVLAPNR